MQREVFKINATGKTLGKLAAEIAVLLQGKHRTDYTPHLDKGAIVIVTNTSKIKVTGKKLDQKKYYRHSGYMGGLKEIKLKELLQKNPNEVLKKAVYGMLPKNKLRAKRIKRLKLFKEENA